VRPQLELAGYERLPVEIPAPTVTDGAVDAQIDGLRDRFADLEESRAPLADGDYAEIDIKGYVHSESIEGLSATDFLYEIGSGAVVPELDAELRGKRAGDILKFNAKLPERFGDRAGQEVSFQVLVKEAKRKVLPALTDAWVSEASELDTVEALRADVRSRLELLAMLEARLKIRDQVLDAVAALVAVDVPDSLVDQELERRVHGIFHQLEDQGATIPQYLEATGQTEAAFLATVREGAVTAVKIDLALRSLVVQEGLTVAEHEMEAELSRLAERSGQKPAALRRDFERRGLIETVRSDLAKTKAVQFLMDHAAVVDENGNPVDFSRTNEVDEAEREALAEHDYHDHEHEHDEHETHEETQ
jgi:trigger factor